MAFPASKGILSEVLEKASARALHTRTLAQNRRAAMAAGNVGSGLILSLGSALREARAELARYAATPGIAEEAQRQFNDPALDVDAEWGSMMAAIDDATAWIRANFPLATDPGGASYLAERVWGADGPVERQFTPAQTAGLRAQLDALIATIG